MPATGGSAVLSTLSSHIAPHAAPSRAASGGGASAFGGGAGVAQSGAAAASSGGAELALSPGRTITTEDIIHGAQFAAPGDVFGYRTNQDVASATVHAVLRAGIRDFDTAPLYTDSEDKLGHALLTASPSNTGQSVVYLRDRMIVGGKEVRIYTKTGRLVRRRIKDAPEGDLGWRPAEVVKVTEDGAHGPRRVGPVTVEKTLPIPKNQRGIADDFSANGVRVCTLRRPVSRV